MTKPLTTACALVSLRVLSSLEDRILRNLDSLPITYRKDLLNDPWCRYPFLYYLLFTHWPEWASADLAPEDQFCNRYYWFRRLAAEFAARHGSDAKLEQQAFQILEAADGTVDPALIQEIDDKLAAETATQEREIAVAFSDFSVGEVKRRFAIHLDESADSFSEIPPVAASTLLAETLRDGIPLALAIGTEKARSELIVAPVLVEVRRQLANAISLFSGVEWNVDPPEGLRGFCDFLLSLSPEQFDIEAPVVAIVEAKKDDISSSIGQCLAEMIAARIFNERRGQPLPSIFGVVTTGNVWKFLRLTEMTAYVDLNEYHIKEVERILGILLNMLKSSGDDRKPSA